MTNVTLFTPCKQNGSGTVAADKGLSSWSKVTAARLQVGDLPYSLLWPRKEDQFQYTLWFRCRRTWFTVCGVLFNLPPKNCSTFLWFEKRLACRLKEIRFTAFKETNFLTLWLCGNLDWLISALLTSTESFTSGKILLFFSNCVHSDYRLHQICNFS